MGDFAYDNDITTRIPGGRHRSGSTTRSPLTTGSFMTATTTRRTDTTKSGRRQLIASVGSSPRSISAKTSGKFEAARSSQGIQRKGTILALAAALTVFLIIIGFIAFG